MEKKLVSLITPCHNSAKFIHRLFDSILEQTYPYVEMFAIDNDSSDNTSEVIKSYIPKFESRGYTLQYIHQEDLGPSAAIQTGLKYIKGKYLLMPDSDDYYNTRFAFEKWVETFETLGDEYAIVRCQLQFINEEDMSKGPLIYKDIQADDTGTYFEDCLFGSNGYNYAPIGYMVRVAALCETTGLNIYNSYNIGQQRQICMPLYYSYKAYTILEPLVCYLVRKVSISHGDYSKYSTQATLYKKQEEYMDSVLKCCKGMKNEEMLMYKNSFMQMISKRMFLYAIKEKKEEDADLYKSHYVKFGGDFK